MTAMVTITFDPAQGAEIAPLVPAEQAHIAELTRQGIVSAIYIGTVGNQVWIVMQGESAAALEGELESFPLRPYMQEIEITPLR